MDWKMSMDLRCPWIGGTHGFEYVHGFGNIIIIKGDNISVHYTGNQNQTVDTTILDNVTKPIVKVLGELFSREDKKSIPTFKGKSTEKLITEWLKAAVHVARNNDWDEDQKLRFFSDRLKGEALEWHDEYVEEQDHLLNYTDWRKDIIERFRDSFDIATLKRKLQKLMQQKLEIGSLKQKVAESETSSPSTCLQ
jgi:hypothetical protein